MHINNILTQWGICQSQRWPKRISLSSSRPRQTKPMSQKWAESSNLPHTATKLQSGYGQDSLQLHLLREIKRSEHPLLTQTPSYPSPGRRGQWRQSPPIYLFQSCLSCWLINKNKTELLLYTDCYKIGAPWSRLLLLRPMHQTFWWCQNLPHSSEKVEEWNIWLRKIFVRLEVSRMPHYYFMP